MKQCEGWDPALEVALSPDPKQSMTETLRKEQGWCEDGQEQHKRQQERTGLSLVMQRIRTKLAGSREPIRVCTGVTSAA